MKNLMIGLAALLLAGAIHAQDITIKWNVSGNPLTTYFLPKVASDGIQNVVVIAETGTGLSAFEDQLGSYQDLPKYKVNWTGVSSALYGPTLQIGHAPSIALAYDTKNNYDTAIEVHQGGQDSESSLWFQLGSNAPPFFSGINWGPATQLGPGHMSTPIFCYPSCPVVPYDNGYNPTVAADLNGSSASSTTVVEVHQSDKGVSNLYYHVGILKLGSSPSISWGDSLMVAPSLSGLIGAQGAMPTVSVANNVAVLVAQGGGGALWYSIGVVDTAKSTIAWTAPATYGSGYNPTVSVWGDGTDLWVSGRVLVEAHQVDNDASSLVYSVGVLGGSSPTSITWSTTSSDTNIVYDTGCYPSVALAYDGPFSPSQVSVTETHETSCGKADTTVYYYGHLVGK
jgi:hypothetical protein